MTFFSSKAWILTGALWLFTLRDAQAYIDPGSSSYFFQLLIAGLTALVFFYSALKRKIIAGFHRLFGGGPSSDPSATPAEPKNPSDA